MTWEYHGPFLPPIGLTAEGQNAIGRTETALIFFQNNDERKVVFFLTRTTLWSCATAPQKRNRFPFFFHVDQQRALSRFQVGFILAARICFWRRVRPRKSSWKLKDIFIICCAQQTVFISKIMSKRFLGNENQVSAASRKVIN